MPRGLGARFGARRRTRGGPSQRVPVPPDASFWPCSVLLLQAVNPGYYGVTTLRRIKLVRTTSAPARNVPAMVIAPWLGFVSPVTGDSSSAPPDYSKANLTCHREVP